jgi:hypothetical protein
VLTGVGIGTSFSGTFMYGASSADIDFTEQDPSGTETSYSFFFHNSTVTVGGISKESINTQSDSADNLQLESGDVDLVNSLFGSSLSAGQTIDIWGQFAHRSTDSSNELEWGVSLLEFSGTLFDDQEFRPVPPAKELLDGGVFSIDEVIDGVLVYSAFGTINLDAQDYQLAEVELVPVPAAVWLFGSALGLLGWLRRKAA